MDPVWAKEPDAKPGVGRLPKLVLASCYDSDEEEEEGGGNLLFQSSGMQYVGPKRPVKMSDCQNSAAGGGQQVRLFTKSQFTLLSSVLVVDKKTGKVPKTC